MSILDRFYRYIDRLLSPQEYRVFTRKYDETITVNHAPDSEQGFTTTSAKDPQEHSLAGKELITVLIDHSGSLRGRPIKMVERATLHLADRFERNGLDYEILAFTTRTWRGGRARDDWERNRRSKPGRVCELRHVIYRDATAPHGNWRDAFQYMLFKDGTLKENIDGEAIEWARDRARRMGASRWRLLVISDGKPVDESTLHANGYLGGGVYTFLDRHLQEVLEGLEQDPMVTVGALGIHYEFEDIYPLNVVARLDGEVSEDADKLADMLGIAP